MDGDAVVSKKCFLKKRERKYVLKIKLFCIKMWRWFLVEMFQENKLVSSEKDRACVENMASLFWLRSKSFVIRQISSATIDKYLCNNWQIYLQQSTNILDKYWQNICFGFETQFNSDKYLWQQMTNIFTTIDKYLWQQLTNIFVLVEIQVICYQTNIFGNNCSSMIWDENVCKANICRYWRKSTKYKYYIL